MRFQISYSSSFFRILMYKVNLRIEKVFLRFKNQAVIQTLIKKDESYFIQPKKIVLHNQTAQINNISEFFIDRSSPTFTIQVTVSFGGANKLAGQVTINLHEKVKSVLYNSVEKLQKSPDKNASIQLNLFYERGPDFVFHKKLLTFRELFQEMSDHIFKKNKQQTINLIRENNRLSNLVEHMKQQNEQLVRNNLQTINKIQIFAKKMNISFPSNIFETNKPIKIQNQPEGMEQQGNSSNFSFQASRNQNQSYLVKNSIENAMTQ